MNPIESKRTQALASVVKLAGTRLTRGGIIPIQTGLRNAVAIGVLTLLAACAATVDAPQSQRAPAGDDVATLLTAAEQSLGTQRSDYLLQATALLLRARDFTQAADLLEEIGAQSLPFPQRAHHAELRARLLLEQGDTAAALQLLRQPELVQGQGALPPARQVGLAQLRARALAAQGDHLASAQQRIAIEPLLNPEQRERNRTQIWRSLMYLEAPQLQAYRDKALGRELQGWLELALVAKQNQGNLDLQLQRLDDWLGQWRGHSAQTLPGDLRLLREAVADQPAQVALLLPLSGQLAPFGQALRDGYMAALYEQRRSGARAPTVRLYDTHGHDIQAQYRQAVSDGAEFVVGPLEKSQVAALYGEPLPIPLLALNRAGVDAAAPAHLYQFSLAPEDEATQLAELARAQGLENALLIIPDAGTEARETQAFARHWQQLGGNIVAQAQFSDQETLSGVIRTAFNIPQSQARAVALERALGRNLVFTPRRRQDVDLAVMFANPAQARSIKPTLAYHFAADVPVYALSRTYAGVPQPEIDQDLEGVRFTEMPWILHDTPLKRTITATLSPSPQLLRFYAMGIDSFYLLPRLAQLKQLPESRVFGQTGTLRLDAQGVVQRELPLAVMKQGRPQELATSLPRLDDNIGAVMNRGFGIDAREGADAHQGAVRQGAAPQGEGTERGRFD